MAEFQTEMESKVNFIIDHLRFIFRGDCHGVKKPSREEPVVFKEKQLETVNVLTSKIKIVMKNARIIERRFTGQQYYTEMRLTHRIKTSDVYVNDWFNECGKTGFAEIHYGSKWVPVCDIMHVIVVHNDCFEAKREPTQDEIDAHKPFDCF